MAALLCLAPSADAKRAVYAPDASGSRLYALPVAVDGALSGIGFLSTAQGPEAVAMAPDGTHFYASMSDGSIASFNVNPGSGALTATGSVQFGAIATSLAVSPSSGLLMAGGGGGDVGAYLVNADGTLAAAPSGSGTSFSDRTVDDVAFDPGGQRLYVASTVSGGAGRLGSYAIDANGSLSSLDEIDAGLTPAGITVNAAGSHVYVADLASDQIVGLTVGSDGHVSATSGSPYPAGDGPRSPAITSDGTRLLVVDSNVPTVASLRISSTGALSSTGSSLSVAGAQSVVAAPDPLHAYVGGAAKIAALDVSSTGALSIRGTQATTDGVHTGIAISPDIAAVVRFDSFPAAAGYASSFQADSSYDPDGSIATFSWDFGDGSKGSGPSPTHVYQSAGTYTVTLRVTDNEGCTDAQIYTGHGAACTGATAVSHSIFVRAPTDQAPPDQTCAHQGNDGFCGTPDQKAPQVTVLGFNDGAQITTVDAPEELVGTVTPDPSGIKSILLRFTKADGTAVKKKTVTRRVCHTVKGKKRCKTQPLYKKICHKVKGKRHCTKQKVVKVIDSKVPLCLTVSGTKTYFVRYECAKVKWIDVGGDTSFRYSLPVALGTGSYTVDAIATDGAGNSDVLEAGRNHMTFKIVKTPSNQDSGGGVGTGPTTTTPSTPIDDTGSPFG